MRNTETPFYTKMAGLLRHIVALIIKVPSKPLTPHEKVSKHLPDHTVQPRRQTSSYMSPEISAILHGQSKSVQLLIITIIIPI